VEPCACSVFTYNKLYEFQVWFVLKFYCVLVYDVSYGFWRSNFLMLWREAVMDVFVLVNPVHAALRFLMRSRLHLHSGTTVLSQPVTKELYSTFLRNVLSTRLYCVTSQMTVLLNQRLPFTRHNYSKVFKAVKVANDKKFYANKVHRAFIIVLRDS
jgi:hypothetical protein